MFGKELYMLGGLSVFFVPAVCNYFKRILGLDHYFMHPVTSLENLYICMYWPIELVTLPLTPSTLLNIATILYGTSGNTALTNQFPISFSSRRVCSVMVFAKIYCVLLT